jgi:hypothetical protein
MGVGIIIAGIKCPVVAASKSGAAGADIRGWFGSVKAWLRRGIVLLCLLCAVHVGLAGYWLSKRFLGPLDFDATDAVRSRTSLSASLFLSVGATAVGLAALLAPAFAERQPRLVNVAEFGFPAAGEGCSGTKRGGAFHGGERNPAGESRQFMRLPPAGGMRGVGFCTLVIQ